MLKLTEGKEGLQELVIRQLPLGEKQPCHSRTWSTCTEEIRLKGRKEQVVYSALDFNGTNLTFLEAEAYIANLTTWSTLVTAVDYLEGRASFAELHTCFVTAASKIKPHYIVMAQEFRDNDSVLERCNLKRKANKILVFVEYSKESGIKALEELLMRLLLSEMQVLTLVEHEHYPQVAVMNEEVIKKFEQVNL